MNEPYLIHEVKSTEIYPAALEYWRAGLSTIPVVGKRAMVKWGEYQNRRPTEDELRSLFAAPRADGVAVVCGAVSGRLVTRDFDDPAAYRAWAQRSPSLAATLATAQTPRGFHVHFVGNLDRIIVRANGEIRGSGYAVWPPSPGYRWIIPPTWPLTRVELTVFGVDASDLTQGISELNSELNRKAYSELNDFDSELTLIDLNVSRLILASVPDRPGMRYFSLWRLARGLKGLPAWADANQEQLEPVLRQWHRRALPAITTKDIRQSRHDLWAAFSRVKFPAGIAGKLASAVDPRFGHEPLAVRVEQLCAALQEVAADAPFFLSCRAAAEVFGVSHVRAWQILRDLMEAGRLVLMEKSDRAKRRAATYRYLAGDPSGP